MVRSAALFCVGLFHYLISLLPQSMTKAASWLSGVGGDRVEGMRLLWQCWEEEGMLCPWAGLIWVSYQMDVKTFLNESRSDQNYKDCDSVFDWARAKVVGLGMANMYPLINEVQFTYTNRL